MAIVGEAREAVFGAFDAARLNPSPCRSSVKGRTGMTSTIRRSMMMLIADAVMAGGAVRARFERPQAGSRGIMSAIPEIPSNKWAAASNAASPRGRPII